MKKTILIALVLAVLAGLFVTASAYAQGTQPPAQATGILHPYFAAALAEKLGLSVDDVNARITNGETMYQIALDEGIAAEDIPALLLEVRTTALKQAVADGVVSQETADLMLQRMQQRGLHGSGLGTHSMGGTGSGSGRRGSGMTPGTGGMGGGCVQQTNP
ncbi:MAG: hypothetical protein FD146_2046 [Anaerolineaceae bacterium]|nr:MAG: hypothetical protein FD146_2046 [Anaerolineaceae bacterium]